MGRTCVTARWPVSESGVLPRRPSPRSRTRYDSNVCSSTRPTTIAPIGAMNVVLAEHLHQPALGVGRAGEDQQPAGVAVEPMHGAEEGPRRAAARLLARLALRLLGQDLQHQFVERGLALFAARGPIALFAVPQRGHAGRLLDDHQMRVEVADDHVVGAGRLRAGLGPDFDHVARLESPPFVDAQVAVDLDVPVLDQPADRRPRLARPQLAERGGDCQVGLCGPRCDSSGTRVHSYRVGAAVALPPPSMFINFGAAVPLPQQRIRLL